MDRPESRPKQNPLTLPEASDSATATGFLLFLPKA
ncbi:hypothetical protein CCACVL1_20712 [Corchorus capsularis]|uniref:Uncharacterized protein n=1 Tax=Corchorus capsularis TaxID=210143 RepID=A0A1R3HAC4_COCAP|nr:hypothetical protein CCACVL1_20712 [Corchorus capsularis]